MEIPKLRINFYRVVFFPCRSDDALPLIGAVSAWACSVPLCSGPRSTLCPQNTAWYKWCDPALGTAEHCTAIEQQEEAAHSPDFV